VYRGRFAPSPSGPLHFGSLLAALGSYLDARAAGGQWLLRIEDIDQPREAPGAADRILRSLDAHGLHWDGPVLYQSTRSEAYDRALEQLQQQDRLFRCSCTRAILGPGGSCGERCTPAPDDICAIRVRLGGERSFNDLVLGPQPSAALPADLVLKRKDGLYAYTLAVVVDDGWQGITDVIRGRDLLEQTARTMPFARISGLSGAGLRPPPGAHRHRRPQTQQTGRRHSDRRYSPTGKSA
jgi:glutamyl-Q tRNA(Asp) synthetase